VELWIKWKDDVVTIYDARIDKELTSLYCNGAIATVSSPKAFGHAFIGQNTGIELEVATVAFHQAGLTGRPQEIPIRILFDTSEQPTLH
jgi:hypothetical protein